MAGGMIFPGQAYPAQGQATPIAIGVTPGSSYINIPRVRVPQIPQIRYQAAGLPPGLSMDGLSRVTGIISAFAAGDFNATLFIGNALGGDSESESFLWHVNAVEQDVANINNSSIGLCWIEISHVDILGVTKIYVWAPVDLVDDANYYGGFKEGRAIAFGDVTRGMSDEQGVYESTEFTWIVSDTDRTIRKLLDSAKAKFWQNRMAVIRMIDDASRRLKLTPYTLARGIIREYNPRAPLHFEFVGRDFASTLLASGNREKEIPFRRITKTDFPNVPPQLEEFPVPVIYGAISDKDEKIVTVSDIVTNSNVTAQVIGTPGTTTYLYTVTALAPPGQHERNPPGVSLDATNPAWDNDHRQEMVWGQVVVPNAPSPAEWVPGTRFVRILWNNVGEQQREAWWGGGVLGSVDTNGHSRVYGRDLTTPQQLLMGLGTQQANNSWDDDGRSSRAPSSNPPVNNVVYEGDPFAPGTQIKVDRGSGVVPTTYVGKITIASVEWQSFLIAGHAMKSIDEWYCEGVRQAPATEGVDFLIPGYAGYIAAVGSNKYQDINGRRYSIMYAKGVKAEQAIDGSAPITLNCQGIEFAGDGTGTLITQLADIYQHILTNFAFQEYQSGPYLSVPVWEQGLDPVEFIKAKIDIPSFDNMRVVHQRRVDGGYPGAFMFGSPTSGAVPIRQILAQLNISCDCIAGFNRHSQYFVSIFDETISILDEAVTYDDLNDILKASFNMDNESDKLENVVNYVFARRFAPAPNQTSSAGLPPPEWFGDEEISNAESIANFREQRQGPRLELWGVRDSTVALDIAQRRLLYYKLPPTPVRIQTTLKGLQSEIGDIIKVDAAIEGGGVAGWNQRPIRLMRMAANPQKFVVKFDGVDAWRLYSTAFILGDDVSGSPTKLPDFWPAATSPQRLRGYLCDETTGAFSTGEDGKRLR